jgi:Fe-S cluster biogenesis protein NfuA
LAQKILDKIETIFDEKIRPVLCGDGGNIAVKSFEDGVLKVRSLGKCANCPSAAFEIDQMVMAEMRTAVPQVRSAIAVTGVSHELLKTARALMGQNKSLTPPQSGRGMVVL